MNELHPLVITYKKALSTDNSNLYAGKVTKFGSNWNNDTNAGAFQLNVNNASSNSNANITAHLKFSYLFYPCFHSCPFSRFEINQGAFITLPLGKT